LNSKGNFEPQLDAHRKKAYKVLCRGKLMAERREKMREGGVSVSGKGKELQKG
jgi:hypothetical protein